VKNIENYAQKTGISTSGVMRVGNPRTYGVIMSIRFF
jgi:hypothetical protein